VLFIFIIAGTSAQAYFHKNFVTGTIFNGLRLTNDYAFSEISINDQNRRTRIRRSLTGEYIEFFLVKPLCADKL